MWTFMKSKYSSWLSLLFVVLISIFGYLNKMNFEIFCAVCAILFLIIQRVLFGRVNEEEVEQRKYCRVAGFFLLIPSLGMIATGVYILFFTHMNAPLGVAYAIIVFSTVLLLCLVFQMVVLWKNKSVGGKFWRLTTVATMAVPLSLIIVTIMNIAGTDEAAMLSGMTTTVFGGGAFLIALNMILVSSYGYGGTIESIRSIRRVIKSRKLVFVRVTILKDIFLVLGKAVISIISLSFFMFANILYSAGMGLARFIAVKMHKQEKEEQIVHYRLVGIIISIASVCYVLYSIRLFWSGTTGTYSMYIALVIALYTFVEFGINIREAFRLRKSKALEAKALRAVSFASTLICFVLTQTAIMSFAAEGDNSFANALSGVVFGALASVIGIYVIIDSNLCKRRMKNP